MACLGVACLGVACLGVACLGVACLGVACLDVVGLHVDQVSLQLSYVMAKQNLFSVFRTKRFTLFYAHTYGHSALKTKVFLLLF